jgi:hypothetical protein
MRRLLGHLTLGLSLGVLVASIGASEAKAAGLYEIVVTITDNTNPGNSTTFAVANSNPGQNNSGSPSSINGLSSYINGPSGAGGTGITFNALSSSINSTSGSATLTSTGNITVTTSDSYTITIGAVNEGYTSPPSAPSGVISESSSGTFTNTNTTSTQGFQSWYTQGSPANPFPPTGTTTGSQLITAIATPMGQSSPSAVPANPSAPITPFVEPFTLTNIITLNFSGGTPGNTNFQYTGSTTVAAAVPEPASLVMLLTGMPMPLMVLGMLRRRKAQRRTDVISG